MFADIAITSRCNLRCKTCDVGMRNVSGSGLAENWVGKSELTVSQWVSIIKGYGLSRVNIIGTEPLLYAEFGKLVDSIAGECKCEIALTTNGWFVDKWFSDIARRCTSVCVSIDGLEDAHDRIRGVPGSFGRAVSAAVELRLRGVRVRSSMAVCPDNVEDIEPLYRMLAGEGISQVVNHFNYIHPESCAGYDCRPTNMGGYDLQDIDVGLLQDVRDRCPGIKWLPSLSGRDELSRYYHDSPLGRRRGGKCVVLKQTLEGLRLSISPDGGVGLSARCWAFTGLGSALDGYRPSSDLRLLDFMRDIRKGGLPAPCLRLCCAGKGV